MIKKEKLAIYGGTFNPPHVGHVRSAEALSRAINPDRFLIIPAFSPPHKLAVDCAEPEDRLNMCRLAFSHIKNTVISDIEIKRGGKSYTSDTLEELAREDRDLYFLCGTDMLLTMSSWYRPERIFSLATICLVRREDDAFLTELIAKTREKYEQSFAARILEIKAEVTNLSSTTVRDAIKNGNAEPLLTHDVFDYIKSRRIY